jgi:hypothetical protein
LLNRRIALSPQAGRGRNNDRLMFVTQ